MPSTAKRLSRISTQWTQIGEAHQERPTAETQAAREQQLARYHEAALRYLRGAVRDEETALSLFQEFAFRFLDGKFHRADRERGRFRDYLRTSLIRLVASYRREQAQSLQSLPGNIAEPRPERDEEAVFMKCCQEQILKTAWLNLKKRHRKLHAVLALRAQDPQATAAELAARREQSSGKRMTENHFRVLVHRARCQLGELVLREVEELYESQEVEQTIEELRTLGLLSYCEPALRRRLAG